MLIGILSDSHGRHRAVRAALELFDELRVTHVIHCGDVGGMGVFDELVGRACTFVWGNTDTMGAGTRAYLRTVGLEPPQAVPTRLELAGRRIAVFHGHEREFSRYHANASLDYIFHGHTHQRRDELIGKVRIINPGALHRAAIKTVATLNLDTGKLTILSVDTGEEIVL